MTTSLGKLQETVIKQEKKIIELQDRITEVTEERNNLKRRLDKLENEFEQRLGEKVNKTVNDAVAKVTEHYEKIIKEKDQRIFELENRLNINSSNSSLPSSQTPVYQSKICNSRKPSNKSKGGQFGHQKHSLAKFNDNEINDTKEHTIDKCPKCNNKNLEVTNIKERDELDFDIKLIKRRHKFYEYECPKCGNIINSDIPLELHGENQYGSGVKTLALTLTNYGFVAYNRTRKIICGLTKGEIDPSEGYLTKLQKKASDKLSNFVFDVKEKILSSKLNYWDDTVVKIGEKDRACLRVYTNSYYVIYKAHMAKDTEGMNEDGILQNLPEDCVVMHDHIIHNYCDEYHYKNIECNAHITRKLEGITQNAKHTWSDDMKNLLEETLEKRKQNIENGINRFTNEEIEEFDRKYDLILEDGFKEYIEFKHKYEFDKEENLLEFMRDFKGPITEWIRDFSLPYSNNLCESLLRMLKTKMKISYQFTSLQYAEYFANIMTYTETCGRFGINKYDAISKLFEGNPYTIEYLDKLLEEKNDNQYT